MGSFIGNLKSDRLLLKSIVCVFVLAVCHWIQFIDSSYMVQPLVRAICATLYVFVACIFGKKSWFIVLFLWAIAVTYWNRFYNFTSFIMILIAIGMNRKMKFHYIFIYSVVVIFCLYKYDDSFTHIIIHAGGCCFFYCVFSYVDMKLNPEEVLLELTTDEEKIISLMAEGYEIKEIDCFSQNVIYEKLKDARKRNGCMLNKHLKERYRKEKSR